MLISKLLVVLLSSVVLANEDTINILNDTVITTVNNINSELKKITNKSIELVPLDEDLVANTSETFLSFDEWKKIKEQDILNNKKKLKSDDEIRSPINPIDPSCYGDRECIGEEMEIDLNLFSSQNSDSTEPEGKIYKDKFNYASLDCAATIVKTNSEASGASSILIENKDKYLLNLCSSPNQFVVIELCEDILVEQVVLANFEYFSSNFKKFSVSVSDRFPVPRNGWTVLGEFQGDNSKNLQTFDISNPQIWAKYLRIEVLSHYGNEFYCPLSLLRVHGKTMMDEFKSDALEHQKEVSLEEQILSEDINIEVVPGSSEVTESAQNSETKENSIDSVASVPTSFLSPSLNKKVPEPKYVMESDLFDESNNWPFFDTENKTLVPQLPDPMEWTYSGLEPLRFEEFLKELSPDLFNCDPKERELNNGDVTNTTNITTGRNITVNNTSTDNDTIVNKRIIPLVPISSPEDSIFKSILRRLNFLENNSTMTILYVEEQSKLLSKSFSQLENVYLNRFDDLVNTFNVTVMNNIDVLKLFAKQLKEQSLNILEEQKKNNEDFNKLNQLRMQKLEEDVRFQRNLIICCILALIFVLYHETIKHFLMVLRQNSLKTNSKETAKKVE